MPPIRLVQNAITTKGILTAHALVPARASPAELVQRSSGTGSAFYLKGAPNGELADLIHFGFVSKSQLIEGRTYAGYDGKPRLLREVFIMPLQQEAERTIAMLSMVLGGKLVNLSLAENGAFQFSTKHTTVDEDGEPIVRGQFLSSMPYC